MGIADKNGKEIYEGDIIKISGWWTTNGHDDPIEEIIKWDDDNLGFSYHLRYINTTYNPDECEIIGNIHENPELLPIKNGE